jgi:hypothetical protein
MPDGLPKQYCRREMLQPWFVDKDNYNFLQLVNDIAQHCLWGSKQYIALWRDLDDVSVEIKTDENLLDWFQCNIEKREVGIIAEIKDFEGPLQFSPTKCRCHPTVRNRGIEDAYPPIVPSKEIHTHKKP